MSVVHSRSVCVPLSNAPRCTACLRAVSLSRWSRGAWARPRHGLTLIEVMVVTAVVGLLAMVTVPTLRGYMRDAKSAEAKLNLKAMSDGALTHFQAEHPNPADGTELVTRQYPQGAACTTSGNQPGRKAAPVASDFDSGAFAQIRFGLSQAHYYRYCYEANDSTGPQAAFSVQATASLDAADDSLFHVLGYVDGDGDPAVTAVLEGASPGPSPGGAERRRTRAERRAERRERRRQRRERRRERRRQRRQQQRANR